MWGSILLIATIIFLNSFALGKIYKRFNIYLSSYSCFSFGMITLFGVFGLILIPLLLFTIKFNVVLVIYLIAQCVLVGVYVINWRWLFISYKINIKNLCISFAVFITIFCGFLITREYANVPHNEINWYLLENPNYLLKFSNPNAELVDVFVFGQNYFTNNFIYIFLSFFVYIFQIQDVQTLNIFYTFAMLFIFMLLSSTSITSIFIKKNANITFFRILILLANALLVSTLSFVIKDYMWIIIFTILLVNTHSLRENEINSNVAIYIINFIVVAAIVFNINFLIVAIVINLINTFLSFQARKEKCTNYNILTLFTTFVMLAMSFSNEFYVGFICLILVIIIYTFYLFYKSSNIANKVNSVIDNFLYEYIYIIIIFIIAVLMITSISFFLTSGLFIISTDVWLLNYIGTPPMLMNNESLQYIYVNILYAIINVFVFLAAIINSGMIKIKKFDKVFGLRGEKRIISSQFYLSIIVVLVFWNPIATNLYNYLINSSIVGFLPNFQVIFAAMIIPCLMAMSKHFYNSEKNTVTGYTYAGIILSITFMLALGINLV